MKRLSFLIPALLTLFGMLLFGCSLGQIPVDILSLGKGSLQVQVSGLPERATQATLEDIDHIQISVESGKSAMMSQTLTQADLTNNNASASHLFSPLWPGTATVSVSVYNAASASIGAVTATASVTANQRTLVNLSLKLNPTDILMGYLSVVGTILPSPTPTPIPTAPPLYPALTISSEASGLMRTDGTDQNGLPLTSPNYFACKQYNSSEGFSVINSTDHDLDLLVNASATGSSVFRRIIIPTGHFIDYNSLAIDGRLVNLINVRSYPYLINTQDWEQQPIFVIPTPAPSPALIISSVDSDQMIMANALDNCGQPQTTPCTRVILDYNPHTEAVTIVNDTEQDLDLSITTVLDDISSSGYNYRYPIARKQAFTFIPPDANGYLVKEISVETYQTYQNELNPPFWD